MKSLRILLVALVGLAFFAMGIWFFSPWETGGVYLLDKIRLFAAKNGVYMTYAEATSSGLVFPKYRLKDFSIEGPMFRTAMPEITITVLPFSSLLAGTPFAVAKTYMLYRSTMTISFTYNKEVSSITFFKHRF